MDEQVAFLGLGIMGGRMAANLARAGHALTVWNRTASKAEAFAAAHGARVAATPAEAAAGASIVITMLVDGEQVERVLIGPDGVVEGAAEGLLCIDCSTIGPSAARAIGDRLVQHQIGFLDAPVTGSAPRAEDGTLTIMVGGAAAGFARAEPLLRAMGELIVHAGPAGHGQMIKLINNSVAAINARVVGEALLLGAGAGVDLDALETVMGAGSGNSTMLGLKAGPMRRHDYTTLFKLDHMLKDVRLCLEEARAAGVPFESAERVLATLEAASDLGHGDDDFAALLDPLERAAGIELK